MRYLASEDILNELMNDYFVTRPIGDDSDSSGDDCDIDWPLFISDYRTSPGYQRQLVNDRDRGEDILPRLCALGT